MYIVYICLIYAAFNFLLNFIANNKTHLPASYLEKFTFIYLQIFIKNQYINISLKHVIAWQCHIKSSY